MSTLLRQHPIAALLLAFGTVPFVPPAGASSIQTYTITHVPWPGEFDSLSINDSGWVAGGRYLWAGGTTTDLGTLGGATTIAEAVNNSGQVVGRSRDANDNMQAFLWQGGVMAMLPTLGGQSGYATAINEIGEVVGYTDAAASPTATSLQATFWTTQGTAVAMDPGRGTSRATALNDSGMAAGDVGGAGFRWENGTVTTFGQRTSPFISDIDAFGNLSGFVANEASLWAPDGTLTKLGSFGASSYAHALNDAGAVVGHSFTDNYDMRAFIVLSGVMYDLNDPAFVDLAGTGWTELRMGHDINELGQIVGVGTRDGVADQVFILTPVPEPGGLPAGLITTVALGIRRRRPDVMRVRTPLSGTRSSAAWTTSTKSRPASNLPQPVLAAGDRVAPHQEVGHRVHRDAGREALRPHAQPVGERAVDERAGPVDPRVDEHEGAGDHHV